MLKEEMKNEAVHHILPYWMNLIDREHGGYYGYVDEALAVDKQYDKGGIATARLLWSFSAAFNTFQDVEYLEHATHAYEFLNTYIMDNEHGGLFWMVDYSGKVTDERKHVYAQSFGIYGLTEYYKASGDEAAYERAMELFELIEVNGFNQENNSYGEEYTKEWLIKDNIMLSENGVHADITTNTLLHVLEAYTALSLVASEKGNNQVKKRLLNLVDIFIVKVWNKKTNHMKVFFDSHWKEIIQLDSYGHDIEATWLLDEALCVLGLHNNPVYTDFVTKIGEEIGYVAYDVDGSLIYEKTINHVNAERVWWCQAEAIVGFVNLYQRSHDEKWLNRAARTWLYTKDYIIDKSISGEWYYSVNKDGKSLKGPITEPWKTPYHNLRACLEIIKRL